LGYYENSFVYNKAGDAVGATNSKALGTDAADKRPVTKAAKQGLPVKQPKATVNKPRLRNRYVGGSLQDIF
jgi:hypothetical protein